MTSLPVEAERAYHGCEMMNQTRMVIAVGERVISELLKGRILGSRIPDILRKIPDIFDGDQLFFQMSFNSQKNNDLSLLMNSIWPDHIIITTFDA